MATKTQNLGLDVGFVGGGEHLRASLAANFERLDSAAAAGGSGSTTIASITDASTLGRQLLGVANAPAARTAIGAGTSSLELGTTVDKAKANAIKASINATIAALKA